MERISHDLVQGSPEWQDFRLEHDGASEIAAVLGLSKKTTRTELLRMKATGTAKEFSDYVQTHILDKGHEVEALSRPIAEEIAGVKLYPSTSSIGRLSASCDGADMLDEITWEHKLINKENAPIVRAGQVPEEHMPQCQQVLMVTGAEKLLFMVSDGTRENMEYVWVEPDTDWFDRIRAGWKQFHEDLATYEHVEVLPPPVAKPIEPLPALALSFSGEVSIVHNLVAFRTAVEDRIAAINLTPKTDQEFVDGKATVRDLDDAAKKAKDALERFRMQNADAAEVETTVTSLVELMDKTRIHLDKTIKAKEMTRKVELLDEHRDLLKAHINGLNTSIGRPYMPEITVDWAAKIKGMRSFDSMQNTLSTTLATAKIAANDVAEKIRSNLKYLRENATDHIALFPDTATIVLKAADDLQTLVKSRIADHKAEEAKKEAAIVHNANCTARINVIKNFLVQAQAKETSAEVQALIEQCQAVDMAGFVAREGEATTVRTHTLTSMQAISDALLKSEQRQADVAKATAPIAEPVATATAPAAAPVAETPAPVAQSRGRVAYGWDRVASSVPAAAPAPAKPDTPPTLRLGQISDRLGFNLTADFIKTLGFEPAAVEKQAKLFHESDFPLICRALIQHVEAAIEEAAALPA